MTDYPQELLPKRLFRLSIELTEHDAQTLYVIRRSLVSKEETINDLGSVRSHAFIEPDKMHLFYSLSCNLFGIYRQEHLQYILDKQEGRLYYTNKDQIDPSRQVLYSVVANPVSIYLKIAHIYQRPYNFSKKKPDGKIQTFVGKCTVVHKPLQANYWHFEVEVVDENNEKILPNDKTWKQDAASHFLNPI